MTWRYVPDFQLQRDRVRREIGDVNTNDQLLQDEEISYAGTIEGSDVSVAARCCEWIAANFSRRVDMTEGKLSIKLSDRARAYTEQAARLRSLDASQGLPFIGGQSISDHASLNDDTDRIKPAFFVGMTDNPDAQVESADNQNQDDQTS